MKDEIVQKLLEGQARQEVKMENMEKALATINETITELKKMLSHSITKDDYHEDQTEIKQSLADHETRLRKLEEKVDDNDRSLFQRTLKYINDKAVAILATIIIGGLIYFGILTFQNSIIKTNNILQDVQNIQQKIDKTK